MALLVRGYGDPENYSETAGTDDEWRTVESAKELLETFLALIFVRRQMVPGRGLAQRSIDVLTTRPHCEPCQANAAVVQCCDESQ